MIRIQNACLAICLGDTNIVFRSVASIASLENAHTLTAIWQSTLASGEQPSCVVERHRFMNGLQHAFKTRQKSRYRERIQEPALAVRNLKIEIGPVMQEK